MRTLHFEGSHGSFTACAVSGHIIHADACTCGDCDQYGGYQSIALVDVSGCDPWALAHGGGDILDAALIYRDGGYVPAMTAHCEEGCRADIAGLLPAPSSRSGACAYETTGRPILLLSPDDMANCPECGARLDVSGEAVGHDEDGPIYLGSCQAHGDYAYQVEEEL